MFRRVDRSVVDFADEYDLDRGLTKESARQYRYAAKSITDWAGRAVRVGELDSDTFNRWLRDLQSGHLSPSTVANRRRHLLALWRAAADAQLCEEPPRRLRPVKIPYAPPRAWTVDEVRALLQVTEKLRRTRRGKMPRNVWWTLAVRIAWDSGLRGVDVLRLKVDDIQPDGLVVIGQSKTNRPTLFRLSTGTMRMLAESLTAHPRKLVVPWGATKESFRRQFANIVQKAGIRRGTWKWIRRSSATDVEKACPGAGASHLGHAHGSTVAAKHYIDPYIIGSRSVCPTPLETSETSTSSVPG
jgi:integrase